MFSLSGFFLPFPNNYIILSGPFLQTFPNKMCVFLWGIHIRSSKFYGQICPSTKPANHEGSAQNSVGMADMFSLPWAKKNATEFLQCSSQKPAATTPEKQTTNGDGENVTLLEAVGDLQPRDKKVTAWNHLAGAPGEKKHTSAPSTKQENTRGLKISSWMFS